MLVASPAKAEPPWRIVEPEQQLIVLYDQDAPDLPARAEDIVGDENGGETTALTAQARRRLADPDTVRFLIEQRMDEELRHRWTIEDVEERLQRYVVLDYPTEAAADAALRRLSRDRNVLSVEFNIRAELSATPIDEPWFAPDFSGQSEFEYQWGIHDTLNLSGAWGITRGTAYVGLPDTGIQINHPDLSQAFRPHFAKNVVTSAGGTAVDEVLFHPKTYIDPVTGDVIVYAGHGTHVAGIIAANTRDNFDTVGGNNPAAYGGAGVCWRCSLIIARAHEGTGGNSAAGLVYAIESGAQVINMSWGWDQAYCPPYPNFGAACDALLLADQRQVVLVGASGNESDAVNVQYPARDARVIPVAGLETDYPYAPK